MANFLISNLHTKSFTFENIRFKKLPYDTEIGKPWPKERGATFQALADDDLDVRPIIYNHYGLIGAVEDVCLLLSLALSSHVYCSKYTINGIYHPRRVLHVSARGQKMVRDDKIQSFLYTAAESLRKLQELVETTGFVPSIYYLLAGDFSELDDVAFILTWIALEILANAYASEQGISPILPEDRFDKIVKPAISRALSEIDKKDLPEKQKALIKGKVSELNRPSIRNEVHKLRDEYGWDFITDELFDNCNRLRNHIMHLGTYAGFDQITLSNLLVRLRDAVQLALIDLLGCSDYVYDLEARKIQIKGRD